MIAITTPATAKVCNRFSKYVARVEYAHAISFGMADCYHDLLLNIHNLYRKNKPVKTKHL